MTEIFDPNYYQTDTQLPVGKIAFSNERDDFSWLIPKQEETMTENELLEEIARTLAVPEIEADEVTAQMVADRTGISWSTADRYLKTQYEARQLDMRRVRLPSGKFATAYRKA